MRKIHEKIIDFFIVFLTHEAGNGQVNVLKVQDGAKEFLIQCTSPGVLLVIKGGLALEVFWTN